MLANLGDLRQQAEKVVPWMARSQKRSGGLMPVSESLDSKLQRVIQAHAGCWSASLLSLGLLGQVVPHKRNCVFIGAC